MSVARTIVAFLIAPLMTPLVLLGTDQSRGGVPFNLWEQLGFFVFVSGFAYAATVLFGVPAFFLFRAKGWTNVFLYVLVGGLIGLLVSVILNYPIFFDTQSLKYRACWALAGTLSALVFRVLSGVKVDRVSNAPAHGET